MRLCSTSSGSYRGGVALAERRASEIVVKLRGEHDLSTVSALTATMTGAIALGDADVVVDLGAVRFLDASTLGAVLTTRALLRQRSRSLTIRDPSACARRLLELCGLAALIEPESSDAGFPVSLPDPVEQPVAYPARHTDPRRAPKTRLSLCPVPVQPLSPP